MKEKLVFSWISDFEADRQGPRSLGMRWDMKVLLRNKQELPMVGCRDPRTGKDYEFRPPRWSCRLGHR